MFLLLLSLVVTVGNCAIVLISQPANVTAYVGETVHFNCTYQGTIDVPFWKIGGTVYLIGGLPARHSYRNQVLTVTDVQAFDSGQTYQCSFFDPQSRVATLTVLTPEGNSAETSVTPPATDATVTLPAEKPTRRQNHLMATTSINSATLGDTTHATATTTGLPAQFPSNNYERITVIVCASTLAAVTVLCISFLAVFIMVFRRKCKERITTLELKNKPGYSSNVATSVEPNANNSNLLLPAIITINDSTAYAVVGESGKMDANSSYELESDEIKEHLYEEITEEIKMGNNDAYGCCPIQEPQSPPETE